MISSSWRFVASCAITFRLLFTHTYTEQYLQQNSLLSHGQASSLPQTLSPARPSYCSFLDMYILYMADPHSPPTRASSSRASKHFDVGVCCPLTCLRPRCVSHFPPLSGPNHILSILKFRTFNVGHLLECSPDTPGFFSETTEKVLYNTPITP